MWLSNERLRTPMVKALRKMAAVFPTTSRRCLVIERAPGLVDLWVVPQLPVVPPRSLLVPSRNGNSNQCSSDRLWPRRNLPKVVAVVA